MEIKPQQDNTEAINTSEKNEKAVSILETPADHERDTAGAGQPGNWKSKIGIPIPNLGKWNPSFQLPSLGHTGSVLWKLAKFYGPGAIISVAYIDPDNYQTAIVAGAMFQFKLLFMILLANIIAIYLQVSLGLMIRSIRLLIPAPGSISKTWSCNWLDSCGDAPHLPPKMAQLHSVAYR
jgi:hypothetical protein